MTSPLVEMGLFTYGTKIRFFLPSLEKDLDIEDLTEVEF